GAEHVPDHPPRRRRVPDRLLADEADSRRLRADHQRDPDARVSRHDRAGAPRRSAGAGGRAAVRVSVMAESKTALLAGEDLEKEYRSGPEVVRVLRGTSVELRPAEMVALVGASGVGKSTLLHLLGGLDRPTGGRVLFNGDDIFTR